MDREGPLQEIFQRVRAGAPPVELRPDGNVENLPGAVVVVRHDVVVGTPADWARSNDVPRLVGLDGDVAALTAARREPGLFVDRAIERAARKADRGVVLL